VQEQQAAIGAPVLEVIPDKALLNKEGPLAVAAGFVNIRVRAVVEGALDPRKKPGAILQGPCICRDLGFRCRVDLGFR
jgi:hypothetical protein